jgi:hypothetical protein
MEAIGMFPVAKEACLQWLFQRGSMLRDVADYQNNAEPIFFSHFHFVSAQIRASLNRDRWPIPEFTQYPREAYLARQHSCALNNRKIGLPLRPAILSNSDEGLVI